MGGIVSAGVTVLGPAGERLGFRADIEDEFWMAAPNRAPNYDSEATMAPDIDVGTVAMLVLAAVRINPTVSRASYCDLVRMQTYLSSRDRGSQAWLDGNSGLRQVPQAEFAR